MTENAIQQNSEVSEKKSVKKTTGTVSKSTRTSSKSVQKNNS